jgi:xanthine dehydrogenase accessory factor
VTPPERIVVREVIKEAVRLSKEGQAYVLATVVHTRGSTPQKPGAKLLVRSDGSGVGTLGGGCVEGDIWFAAKEALRDRSGPVFRDYLLNEDIAARDGLVCGGSMYFYIDPVTDPNTKKSLVEEIDRAHEGGPPVALAYVVNAVSPGIQIGAHLLVRHDGSTVGTLGDPAMDRQSEQEARALMPLGMTTFFLSKAGDSVYVEGFTSPATLILMGGGHVNRCVARFGKALGFRILVMDDRPEFANKERFPEAEEVAVISYDRGLEPFHVSYNTAVIVATRGHQYDDMALEVAARSSARYVGLIGSKRKTILIFEQLLKREIPVERLKEIHAPIGLDIGGRTPEEIAVSILAEILSDRYGATGNPMKLEETRVRKLYDKTRSQHVRPTEAPPT